MCCAKHYSYWATFCRVISINHWGPVFMRHNVHAAIVTFWTLVYWFTFTERNLAIYTRKSGHSNTAKPPRSHVQLWKVGRLCQWHVYVRKCQCSPQLMDRSSASLITPHSHPATLLCCSPKSLHAQSDSPVWQDGFPVSCWLTQLPICSSVSNSAELTVRVAGNRMRESDSCWAMTAVVV